MSTVYTSLCRGLEYLLKISYFNQDYPNVAEFFMFNTLCWGRSKTLPYVWKKYHKNEQNLSLVTHIFTKLSQNVCQNNMHILMYRYDRCNCKSCTHFGLSKCQIWLQVMEGSFKQLRFFGHFSYFTTYLKLITLSNFLKSFMVMSVCFLN